MNPLEEPAFSAINAVSTGAGHARVRILTLPPKPVGRDSVEPFQSLKFSDSSVKYPIGS